MHRACFYLAAALAWLSLSVVAQAQLVQVGPGFVKAPFVRVYWGPGGSYVRAPFVSVGTPGFRSRNSAYAVPTDADLAQMDWQSLCRVVRESNAQLDADLNQFPSGSEWKTRLKTADVAALLPWQVDAPPTEDARQQLQEILQTQNAQNGSAEFSRVANLVSFKVLQAALSEYVIPPDQRPRRQLLFAARDLNRSLQRFDTGDTWQRYLRVAPGLALSEEKTDSPPSVPSPDDLTLALAHFDSVLQNPDFRVISSLPAFQTTRQRLAAFLGQPGTPQAQPPEELPAPSPGEGS
jgi:hypothetical protein